MHMSAGVVILILSMLLLANFYVVFNYYTLIKREEKRWLIFLYWIFHGFCACALVVNFWLFFTGRHYGKTSIFIEYAAGFTVGFCLYSIIMFMIRDVFRQLARVIPFHDASKWLGNVLYRCGLAAAIISTVITIYGFYNAQNIKVTDYSVTIESKKTEIPGLNVVFISDLHVGSSVREAQLRHIVEKVNNLNPDLILLGGDFFDDGTTEKLKKETTENFKNLSASYGVYYVAGNHECYIGYQKQEEYFKKAGIHVIDDQVVTIKDKFILVGRKDLTGGRKKLSELMKDVNNSQLPVLLLDHEPVYAEMKKVQNYGVDLQLSGHTHAGQVVPLQFLDILDKQPELGLYRTGRLQTIVSSGAGTWAIPLRIGSRSEIVNVHVSFSGESYVLPMK